MALAVLDQPCAISGPRRFAVQVIRQGWRLEGAEGKKLTDRNRGEGRIGDHKEKSISMDVRREGEKEEKKGTADRDGR